MSTIGLPSPPKRALDVGWDEILPTVYSNFDRGALPEERGTGPHKVSIEFLQRLVEDLYYIRRHLILSRELLPPQTIMPPIKKIMEECNRLENGHTLFSDSAQQADFLTEIHQRISEIIEILQTWRKYKGSLRNVYDRWAYNQAQISHSSYLQGLEPWTQWLSNGTPCLRHLRLPRDVSQVPQATQTIPPAGLKILQVWRRDAQQIQTTVEFEQKKLTTSIFNRKTSNKISDAWKNTRSTLLFMSLYQLPLTMFRRDLKTVGPPRGLASERLSAKFKVLVEQLEAIERGRRPARMWWQPVMVELIMQCSNPDVVKIKQW